MSDQQQTGTGVILDLEEVFGSREFGRCRAHRVPFTVETVESQPAQLEQVFLSEFFGHPEAFAEPAPAVSDRPILVLLRGGGEGGIERDATRRAIAAVSGVAAAALVVAGMTAGTGHGPGRPTVTEQAQAALPNQGTPGPAGGAQRGSTGLAAPAGLSAAATPGTSVPGATFAQLTSFSPSPAAQIPPGANVSAASGSPPAAPTGSGGGTPPGTPPGSGSGSGSTLAPALTVIGNEVSGVGSAATATSGDLGQALPVSSTTSAVGVVVTSAMDDLGGGTPPNILAGALK
jgi:hypothetical protein